MELLNRAMNRTTCYGLKFLIIIFVLLTLIITTSTGYEVFFPLSSIKLTIPKTEHALRTLTKIRIAKFQIISLNHFNPIINYLYKLDDTNSYLGIEVATGELYLGSNFQNLNESKVFILTAYNPRQETFHTARMTIEIVPSYNNKFCAEFEKLCFWEHANYSIGEDNKNGRIEIGPLASSGLQYLCPQNQFSYEIIESNNYVKLENNKLFTKIPLDHDTLNPGPNLNVNIRCTVKTNSNNLPQDFEKRFEISVLDRNDNGAKFQDDKNYTFYLNDPHFIENQIIGNKIMLLDQDSLATNTHLMYEIHNDSLEYFKPICNAYETDHKGLKNSVISCQLAFIRHGIFRKSPYCIVLEALDMSLDLQQTNDTKSILTNICIKTDLRKIHENDLLSPRALALAGRGNNNMKKGKRLRNSDEALEANGYSAPRSIIISYPKDVHIYRTATNLSRVAQPSAFRALINAKNYNFSLIDDPTSSLGITPLAGIIYIKNTTALDLAPETIYHIQVGWKNEHANIIVHLDIGRPVNTTCDYKVDARTKSCSHVANRKNCARFCGLGTNGGNCMWRGLENATLSTNYATCTPNSSVCPDNVCDPLEELDHFMCAQDCLGKIMGIALINQKSQRGIYSASGVCTCDETGKCHCAPPDDKPRNHGGKKKKDNLIALNKTISEVKATLNTSIYQNASFECGPACIILAVLCPLFLIIIVISLVISRRKYIRQAKRKGLNNGKSCDGRTVDLPLVSLENDMKFDINSDTKWEFPRDLLILDIVLGEGEFGKVVRGYATNIGDRPGITTVAVKMLKYGANSAEHLALLSEYQLLQEVSHPNVIKLLGACTKGESPLLIIEYCKHGSLRSYLRLSRKIESAGVDFTDGVEPVNVKDILSFAWQICKGMSYLTEIKLVHRDLAARNVLLSEGKICKISDFGLTRDVYEDDAYMKKSRDRVPVKWMAPESLADHVYTTKSDVWAFGILAWELITLGASPYPGIQPQNLYHLLKTGYRMERPENCSEEIYSILRSCWTDDSNSRPSFKYLASQWEKLLGNNVKYLELEATAVSNPLYCEDNVNKSFCTEILNDWGEPENLEHLWRPPKIAYDNDTTNTENSCNTVLTDSRCNTTNGSDLEKLPFNYDMPRPLIETATTEQILRYENDLTFPLNTKQKLRISQQLPSDHYSIPVKRGKSYLDMSNKAVISDKSNINTDDIEKKFSKDITFRFSSLLNLNEQIY